MSDSPGLVDFAIRLVIFVLNLPGRQAVFWGNSNYRRIVINRANQKGFKGQPYYRKLMLHEIKVLEINAT